VRILLWHVHGSWTTAFVQGGHQYLVPVLPDRGPDGVGRARTWDWPRSVVELSPAALRHEDIDVVILQRPHEIDLATTILGRRPGIDVPAVYLEHNTPDRSPCDQRHPVGDRQDIPVVHVTRFNQLYWDTGSAPSVVIEHGIVDPGHRYSGERPVGGVVVNEPGRRGRSVGADLVVEFARSGPVDMFGMRCEVFALGLPPQPHPVTGYERIRNQDQMHSALARRRVYLHLSRWTSLGLSLIEAMHLGMPVLGLAATAAPDAVPREAGLFSLDLDEIGAMFRTLLHEPAIARFMGQRARTAALERFGLQRFLRDWDVLLDRVVGEHRPNSRQYRQSHPGALPVLDRPQGAR
jgi:glycosyltransferase involved in cell wall biosynthesis